MPIRNVVTRGYSNGTFSIGTSTIPTRGYSILDIITGTGNWTQGMVFLPGAKEGQVFIGGFQRGEVYLPGSQEGMKSHGEL